MRLLEPIKPISYEYQGFWGSFSDIIWWFLALFIFISYLFVLVAVIGDLFRDHKLNGWWKAVWVTFLLFFPIVTALVYLIARGRGMSERSQAQARRIQEAQSEYIRSAADTVSPTEEITKARVLLDTGVITQNEYETLKAKALS